MRLTDEQYMRLAIEQGHIGFALGEVPFGTILVNPAGEVVSAYGDHVARDNNQTSHSESLMVREACATFGPDLTGYTIYSTAEPCPMCFTAMWLSRVSRVVFGPRATEVRAKAGPFLHELWMPSTVCNKYGDNRVKIEWGLLRDECLALFDPYLAKMGSTASASSVPAGTA